MNSSKHSFLILVFLHLLHVAFCQNQITGDDLVILTVKEISVYYSYKTYIDTIINGEDTTFLERPDEILGGAYRYTSEIIEIKQGLLEIDTIQFSSGRHLIDYSRLSMFPTPYYLVFLIKRGNRYFNLDLGTLPLYLTEGEQLACCYPFIDYYYFSDNFNQIKPQAVTFKEPLVVRVNDFSEKQVSIRYPNPYFKKEDAKAIAVYGWFVDDLIKIKKLGFLTHKGVKFTEE